MSDCIIFNGAKYYKRNDGYRIANPSPKIETYLRRAIWIEAHGSIPEGCRIYHIDGDKYNNDIKNLKILFPNYIIFEGIKYYKDEGGHYCSKIDSGRIQNYLHRMVWIKIHGAIPEGYSIHHIDGNKDNNDISNLDCIHRKDHVKYHANTPKGKKQRSEVSKNTMKNRYYVEKICAICGNKYSVIFTQKNRSVYCSAKCGYLYNKNKRSQKENKGGGIF